MSSNDRYSEALDLHVLGDYRADRKATAAAFASPEALKAAYPHVLQELREECSYRGKDVEKWGLPMSLGYLRTKARELEATEAAAAKAAEEDDGAVPHAPAEARGRRRKSEDTPS